MRWTFPAVISAAVLFSALQPDPAVTVASECTVRVTRPAYAEQVRREYAEPFISRAEFDALAALRACALPGDRGWMIRYGHRTHARLGKHRRMGRLSLECGNRPDHRVVACIRLAALKHGASLGLMMRIINCESGRDPTNVNSSSGASGLGQFLLSTWRGTPVARRYGDRARFSARHNADAMAGILAESGTGDWAASAGCWS